MTASQPTNEAIFHAARDIPDPDRRRAYVREACGGDESRVAYLEALLAAADAPDSLLDRAAGSDPVATIGRPTAEGAGTVIGPYKLIEPIGEGGMGTVWLAQQTEPVRRLVAIKFIKAGLDSRQLIARFEAERQALAMMDHPNIAKVLDAGATPDGRPYFAMELVKGIPITRYCDERRMSVRERLELFVPVCQAVQHAHQKGVIHRDLKPSNVLVAPYDGVPVVKVIDFGVAKAAGQPLTERTLATGFGAVVGTLEYMSPEQAELNNLDIDTRSDVYVLGVLLYELLTGTTPLPRKRLEAAAFAEVLRIIREEEPPRPSTRLSTTEELPSIAANRGAEPARLRGLVRGELDWIVMKALEKDRSRRYETASGFAMDLHRYLADEPVLACPPSVGYRLRKFVRRNKGPVLAVAIVFLTLLCGIVGMTFGLVRADQARRAEADRANWEGQAGFEARAREAETRAVLEFVENRILSAAKPAGRDGGLGYDLSVRQAIDAALPFIETDFRDRPLLEARLRRSLGWSFVSLGEYKAAADQFQAAHRIYAKQLGLDHPDTLRSITGLVCSYGSLGRQTEALELADGNLARQQVALGHDHPETLWTKHFLALSLYHLDRHAEAARLNQETLALREAKLGPDHFDTLSSMSNLALCYSALDRHEEAHALNLATLALREAKLGPNHPETLQSMSQLALVYRAQGRYPEALELHNQTLALRKATLGPDHPETLLSMEGVSHCLHALGRHQDALELRAGTLPLMKKKLGIDHPHTLEFTHKLADSYATVGRHAEAVRLHEEAVALAEDRLGRDRAETLKGMHRLADSYATVGRRADALKVREEVLRRAKPRLDPDHADTIFAMQQVAVSLIQLKRRAEALELLDEVLERRRATLAPDHRDTLWTMSAVAECRVVLGRGAEAVPLIDECVQRAAGKPAHADIVLSMMALRLRHYKITKDLAGVRATAEMWERLNRTDPNGLFKAACFRAVNSAILKVDPKTSSANATRLATEEADRAMAWLHKAVAAGFKDAGLMAKDADLDALRGREDFKDVLAELEGKRK